MANKKPEEKVPEEYMGATGTIQAAALQSETFVNQIRGLVFRDENAYEAVKSMIMYVQSIEYQRQSELSAKVQEAIEYAVPAEVAGGDIFSLQGGISTAHTIGATLHNILEERRLSREDV